MAAQNSLNDATGLKGHKGQKQSKLIQYICIWLKNYNSNLRENDKPLYAYELIFYLIFSDVFFLQHNRDIGTHSLRIKCLYENSS